MELDLAGQLARSQECRAEVRRHDASSVRVQRRLVPDRPRLAAVILRLRGAADLRELLPDGCR